MRRLIGVALCCALIACDARLGPDEGPTFIRFVNAVPDALSPITFTLPQGPSASLQHGASSEYADVTARVYTITVRDESNGWNVSGDLEVAPGLYQSLIAFGTVANEAAILVSDEPGTPRPGSANVRFLHLAPLAPNLDVHVVTEGQAIEPDRPLFGGLTYPSNPGHIRVSAGTARIVVTTAGTASTLFRSNPLEFLNGEIYTVIITNADDGTIELMRLPDGA